MFCSISHSKDTSKVFEESFFLYKLCNYFPPSDIPSNNENNKDIKQLFAVLAPGVVLQVQVSRPAGQDLGAFQGHPADLPRRFQKSFELDRLSSLAQQQVHPGHRVY